MAKIIHNNINDTINSALSVSQKKGVIHLHAEDKMLNGRHLTLKNQKVLHFGTCGYLGLEHHPELKKGAIRAIEKYGTQFPMSRTYVSSPLYKQLEDIIFQMYNAPVVISKNCTLAHLATIPIIVRQEDLIILDHQVHSSVQGPVKKMLANGVDVEMIRHNNMEMLESIIKRKRSKYNRIWYMADGVYSMYGDFAPIKDLIELAEKYKQLYLYIDDAHGMSWAGKNGTGYVMSQMDNQLYRKMILTANLGKAFGACGGLTVFPNEKFYSDVHICGGPLSFSVQIEPATLGAAIASAKIHTSAKIYQYQNELRERIIYFNELLRKTDLPLVEENESPIFFIGVGTMEMGNHLVNELVKDGIYVNLGAFPAVPAKNIGLRITICRHNTFEDIDELVHKLQFHFYLALEETNQTQEKIQRAFRLDNRSTSGEAKQNKERAFSVKRYNSITQISKETWDNHLGYRAMFDWSGMHYLERSFTDNKDLGNNWKFEYFIAKDQNGSVILMTFYITALYKEDIFSNASVSIAVEKERELNPDYLVSTGVFLGSLFTEGNHLYINRTNPDWKNAFRSLFDRVYEIQDEVNASNIMLRDFDSGDKEMDDFMMESGFVRVDLPESCVIQNFTWQTEDEFIDSLTKEGKKNFKRYIKRHENLCRIEIKGKLSNEELSHAYSLHKAVNEKNMAINSFLFPERAFEEMNNDPSWEFVLAYINSDNAETNQPIVVCFCHKNSNNVYSFMLTGIDYRYVYKYSAYRLSLYAMVKRAKELGSNRANFGISATIEKKRVGAIPIQRVGYYQAKDNYVMEMIENTIITKTEKNNQLNGGKNQNPPS